MHVRDVQLYNGDACPFDGVMKRYAGVRVGTSIEHHASQRARSLRAAGFLNSIYQNAFVVALPEVELEAMPCTCCSADFFYISQRL